MKSIKGTRTEKNLLASFAGESQARNRYNFFASKARKEGFEQIAAIFDETAAQEKEHAKKFFTFLEGGDVEIVAMYPAGVVGTTLENLTEAANGERHEYTVLYPEAARIADQEGFSAVATLFRMVCVAEEHHEKRYRKLAALVEKDQVFKREETTNWACRNCGYVHEGKESPEKCPSCAHPMGYFEKQIADF